MYVSAKAHTINLYLRYKSFYFWFDQAYVAYL